VSFDVLGLIWQAGLIVKLVLLLLALMSVVSWAIVLYKWREIRRANQDSEAFLEVYQGEGFDVAYDAARHLERSPLAVLFLSSVGEMSRMAKRVGQAAIMELDADQVRSVTRRLSWTGARESESLERGLAFLATTGSSAPFIGLFGTVVGIIQSFQSIAQAGSASLAVVAPGIAEALIATAVGLLAAIPATIFYNHFVGRVAIIQSAIERFAEELDRDLVGLAKKTSPRFAE